MEKKIWNQTKLSTNVLINIKKTNCYTQEELLPMQPWIETRRAVWQYSDETNTFLGSYLISSFPQYHVFSVNDKSDIRVTYCSQFKIPGPPDIIYFLTSKIHRIKQYLPIYRYQVLKVDIKTRPTQIFQSFSADVYGCFRIYC